MLAVLLSDLLSDGSLVSATQAASAPQRAPAASWSGSSCELNPVDTSGARAGCSSVAELVGVRVVSEPGRRG